MIAEARVTVREPIQGGELVIHYAMQKPARRDMRSPFPPAWPWQVEPELQLLRAFVEIVEANAARGQRTGPCLECEGGGCETCGQTGRRSHAGDAKAMAAAFASALRRLEAREQGQLSPAGRKRAGEPVYAMPDAVRALFDEPDPIRALIGGKADSDGHWKPGLALLTPSEQQALWLHLHGLSRAAVALAMAPQRLRRFGREAALPLATISKYLWRARVKLRQNVFSLPVEDEAAYLEALDAEEARAALERRDVDPAAAALPAIERERRLLAWPARWEELDGPSSPPDEENPEGEPWLP